MNALSKTLEHVGNRNPSRHVDVSTVWSVGLVVAGLLAWIHLIFQTDMGHGHGPQLAYFPLYMMGWVIMLTAMMLPTEIVYVRVYASLLANCRVGLREQAIRMACFITGYGIAWVIYGTAAFICDGALRELWSRGIGWTPSETSLLSTSLFLTGVYQISPLKQACLSSCRSPLSYFTRKWKNGYSGSLRMGVSHGIICVGCCWALMALLFITGVVGIIWMGLLTLIMFAEKVLPWSHNLSVATAVIFILLGIWVALSPESIPLLKPVPINL
ncbi:MAG: DUF2182 domain-containing protein [Nitrospira sp.]|nr:DUF2182 domain-containing protein [Nitrospira sp.]